MLVDLTPRPFSSRDRLIHRSRNFYAGDIEVNRIDRGMYLNTETFYFHEKVDTYHDYSVRLSMEEYNSDRKYLNRYYSAINRGPYKGPDRFQYYGMVDHPSEFLKRFPHFDDIDEKLVVFFRHIQRKDQPKIGGFRYHKNGKYYGAQKPRSEYLYDDTHIDEIYSFVIYKLK